jgi:predicted enzyme related to lactoylglutathione lyase
MDGEISFLELGVGDVDRARAFYGTLFGWRFGSFPGMQGQTIEGTGLGTGIHGGDASASPYVFFRVRDLDVALARVRELGGEVIDLDLDGDAAQIARWGRFRLCKDDQGSGFGLHQPPE